MNYILFDGASRNALLPFTYTRPVAEIRIGILTIREKWEKHLGYTTSTVTEEYLSEKFPMVELEENIMINASYTPYKNLVKEIKALGPNQAKFPGGSDPQLFPLRALNQFQAAALRHRLAPQNQKTQHRVQG